MKRTSILIGVLIFVLAGAANSLNNYYEWKPLATGGGGWVTGINFGTDQGSPILARTDRGGCYRYDGGNKKWDNIATERNLPADDPLIVAGAYGGSLALVSSPANPDRAYMAFGNERTTIYISDNSGDTWQPTALKDLGESSNGDGKIAGPRLAVDPFSSDIVFYASASSGLFVTTNRGITWNSVAGLPSSGETTYGVTSVIFNPAHGTTYDSTLKRERCRVVYCSIWRVGIFLSRDGGNNWVKISRGDSGDFRIPADDAQVPRLALGQSVDPLLFVVDTFAGFYRYKYNDVNNTGTWRLFNPEGSRTDWRTIAVSPKNSNVILMVDSVGGVWRTVDGGDTFTNQLPLTRNSTGDVAWLDSVEDDFMIVGDVVFDPVVENRIWMAEGTGVWYADNAASSSRINWVSMTKGIEGLVSMTAVHPPNGDLITGHQNRAIFLHSSKSLDTAYPASYGPTKRFNSAWDIQYSAGDPRFLVANVFDQRQCCSTPQSPDNQAAYSTNGGKDWKIFTGITSGTWPVDYKFGNIAVAAMDTKNIVVLPTADLAPMYSLDRGVTWNISVLPDTNGTAGSHSSFNLWRSVLTADSVQDRTFYIFHSATLRLYVSKDGGATWNYTDSTTRLPPLSNFNAKLRAHPKLAGTLMLSYGPVDGRDTGLFVTSDFGQNWRQLPGIRSVRNFAWGAPRNSTGNFTLYAQAKNASNPIDGPIGIFCSLDNGENWGRLTRYPLGIPATAQAMAADMSTFGRVYIGFPGNGFAFGQLNPDAPDVPETFCTAKWDSSLTFKSPGTESAASSLSSAFLNVAQGLLML